MRPQRGKGRDAGQGPEENVLGVWFYLAVLVAHSNKDGPAAVNMFSVCVRSDLTLTTVKATSGRTAAAEMSWVMEHRGSKIAVFRCGEVLMCRAGTSGHCPERVAFQMWSLISPYYGCEVWHLQVEVRLKTCAHIFYVFNIHFIY